MIRIRNSDERGRFDHGWLDTRHTFSFADYHDPEHMGFRDLRVLNEDRIAPGTGFPTHGHRDMEILSFVLAGALEHRDDAGHGAVLRPGEVQRMSAGRGVRHSEYNASTVEPVHLLQVWILPASPGGEPSYEQRPFPAELRRERLLSVITPDGRDGSLRVNQDVAIFATALAAGQAVDHGLAPGRHAWTQVTRGVLDLNGHRLRAGDGAAISDEQRLELSAVDEAEALLFDLR